MSHHLDSPIARQDVRLDITDLYVFRGETGTAFVINVCPTPSRSPQFPATIRKACTSSRSISTATLSKSSPIALRSKRRDAQGKQKYTIRRVSGKDAVDRHAAGTVVAQGVTDETVTAPSGLRAWAGHAGDPFWIEPECTPRRRSRVRRWNQGGSHRLESEQSAQPVCRSDGVCHRVGSARHRTARRCRQQPKDRCMGSSYTRNRCRRMALDQPYRTSDDASAVRSVRRRLRQSTQRRTSFYGLRNLRSTRHQVHRSRGLPHTVQLKIPTHMPRRSRIACSPTCFLTQLARRHRLASSNGTSFPHGQCAQCHVLHGGEYSHPTWDRQGISHVEATQNVPLRSSSGVGIDRLGWGQAQSINLLPVDQSTAEVQIRNLARSPLQWPRQDILHATTIMIESGTQPATSAAIQQAEERLQTLLPGIYRGRTDEVRPRIDGLGPRWRSILDGNVEWDRIWGSFCDLAMAGGPPHKGKLLEPGTQESIMAEPERYARVCDEIVRGIALASRLQSAPSSSQGWLRVACKNQTMAEWLLRAITMENISVRLEEGAILLPAGPAFRMEKEIKNVITVAAKTTHYWNGHLIRLQQLGIANLFKQLESEAPLLQPAWCPGVGESDVRERIQRALEDATGLRTTDHYYADWIGLDCLQCPISGYHHASSRGEQHFMSAGRDRDLPPIESRRRSSRRTSRALGCEASGSRCIAAHFCERGRDAGEGDVMSLGYTLSARDRWASPLSLSLGSSRT